MTTIAGNAHAIVDSDLVAALAVLSQGEGLGRANVDTGAAANAFFRMKDGTRD